MNKAPSIELTEKELNELNQIIKAPTSEYRMVIRAKIIISASKGNDNEKIGKEIKVNKNTISKWRNRFFEFRLGGLSDTKRSGRKCIYGKEKKDEVVNDAILKKPENATHWSTRKMAEHSKISHMTVWRTWNDNKIKPHILRTFKLSNDKHFEEKLKDVVGLYMNPPEHAMVFCVDEKSQIQALDRTQPGLPIKKGKNGTWTHDYVRHGTCTLFAALNYAEGTVISSCEKRHRHQEYLRFLSKIDKETNEEMDLHLIVDNYCTHKHKEVRKWLDKHSRFHIHFIPTSSSWLNLVERFFGKITDDRIRRGIFKSVMQLVDAINDYIKSYNAKSKPFIWTKTADQILDKVLNIKKSINTI